MTTIPDEAVEAADRALSSDHGDEYCQWDREARIALEAVMPFLQPGPKTTLREGKRAERPQKRGNTAKALAAAWDNGHQASKNATNPFRQETPLSNNCTVGKHDTCPANHTPITCNCACHTKENQS